MDSSVYRFNLDLHQTQSQISLPVRLGDTARKWLISLSDGGKAYHVADGVLVSLNVKRPSGTKFTEFCAVEDNAVVVYDFSQNENTAAVEGVHECDLLLTNAEGFRIASARFSMIVSDTAIPSDDYVVTDEDKTVIDSVLATEAARQSAEIGRVNAEATRVSAEAERVAAEELREAATSEAISNAKSAYVIAVENGYEGTEEEFGEGLALVASVVIYNGEAVDIE